MNNFCRKWFLIFFFYFYFFSRIYRTVKAHQMYRTFLNNFHGYSLQQILIAVWACPCISLLYLTFATIIGTVLHFQLLWKQWQNLPHQCQCLQLFWQKDNHKIWSDLQPKKIQRIICDDITLTISSYTSLVKTIHFCLA